MMIPGEATTDHARHFAQLAQMASDEFYTFLLGKKAEDILSSAYVYPDHDNSCTVTHFLVNDGEVMGMMNGYTAKQNQAHGNQTERLIMKYASWRILRYFVLGTLLYNITNFVGKNLQAGDYYIQMVAIYPQYRGKDYSKQLLNHAYQVAISQECQRLVLDVDERNTVAIGAYKKMGFEVIDQSKKIRESGQEWGILRMAVPIDGQ